MMASNANNIVVFGRQNIDIDTNLYVYNVEQNIMWYDDVFSCVFFNNAFDFNTEM